MATDTERFEMLSLIVELILNEGEGVSPEDLLRAQKFHEAASAGYNMFKLRGRELVDCAMNAVRFDEVGPAKSMELVQQMIDERTDTDRVNHLEAWNGRVILGSGVKTPDEGGYSYATVELVSLGVTGEGATLRNAIDDLVEKIANPGALETPLYLS